MAEIRPFHGLRYDVSQVSLGEVVTQPYDKITPAMQAKYYAASPYNLVRIILGRAEAGDNEHENVYTRAAHDFEAWQQAGILKADQTASIYAYSQRFELKDNTDPRVLERKSFIAIGKLYDYTDKIVFRHEQTLAKPKADRLNLLRATQAHFGQIFMLYSDPASSINRLLFDDADHPQLEVKDEYGVLHRLRRISDPGALNIVCTEMADKKLIIADGHHRYETALNYRKELREVKPQPAWAQVADFVMMTFVNMDEPGLVILPTHRVVFGLRDFDFSKLQTKLRDVCEISPLPTADPKVLTQALAQAGNNGGAFVMVSRSGNLLIRMRQDKVNAILKNLSPRQQKLDVVQLHQILLNRVIGIDEDQIHNQTHVRYLREATEAVNAVHNDPEVNAAFLMNPVNIEQMREVAFSGEVLPQKSTDFFPKLLSGLTAYSLKDESNASSKLGR
jgi:uncharacterized protein (DUF1015 family)